MSCIRFNTPEQRQQMREAAPVMLTQQEAASRHPAPAVTESKIRRLRALAVSTNPKIRESVASSNHAPVDVFAALSRDADVGVRSCIARNERVPAELLRFLAEDDSEVVRGWLAVNQAVPEHVLTRLLGDASETVRGLAGWRVDVSQSTESPR